MLPQNLNQNTYLLSATATSGSITMNAADANQSRVLVNNIGTKPVLVLSGGKSNNTAPTAVYPTSATVPVSGQVVPAGAIETFAKNPGDPYISAICGGSDTTTLMISPATGD